MIYAYCKEEVRAMLKGVITSKTVLLHPITLFRCLSFSVAVRVLIWAIDSREHRFIDCMFL